MLIIEDEFPMMFSPKEMRSIQRLRSLTSSINGWIIGEVFNERFHTEVGGFSVVAQQWIDDNGKMQSKMERDARGNLLMVQRPSVIIDEAHDGAHHTAEEVAGKPEFAAVLARLRERETLHAQHLVKKEAERVLWVHRQEAVDLEMKRRGVRFLPRQVVRRVHGSIVA
jgi:hypothetical protein